MKSFFVDTNVLLDLLGQREPFGADAAQLLEAAVRKEVVVYVSGLSFSHIDYVLRKTMTVAERLYKMTRLASIVEIIPLDRLIIEATFTLGFADFEDGLQYCAARAVPAIEAIVTRDPKGFAAGALPVLTPPAALAALLS